MSSADSPPVVPSVAPPKVIPEETTPLMAISPFDAQQADKHQSAWAKYLELPVEYTNEWGMKFKLIPPGEYLMGATESDTDARPSERPQVAVRIPRPFYMGMHEVTQAQYVKVMGEHHGYWTTETIKQFTDADQQSAPEFQTNSNQDFTPTPANSNIGSRPSRLNSNIGTLQMRQNSNIGTRPLLQNSNIGTRQSTALSNVGTSPVPSDSKSLMLPNYPMDMISWQDAMSFCDKINLEANDLIEKSVKRVHYRIPRQEEWEYACRAGTIGKFPTGDSLDSFYTIAVVKHSRDDRELPRPVGSLAPNAWNLFDMNGNLREWCQDRNVTYDKTDENREVPPANIRVLRGGCYGYSARDARSSTRFAFDRETRSPNWGFRILREISHPKIANLGFEEMNSKSVDNK